MSARPSSSAKRTRSRSRRMAVAALAASLAVALAAASPVLAPDGCTGVSAALAGRLNDLSFTYHEAREAILADLAPTVEKAIMTVLPELARQAVGALAVEQLHKIVRENSETPVVLSTAPDCYQPVIDVMPEDKQLPVEVVRDESLAEGQVRFEFAQRERLIDLSEVLEAVAGAMTAFTHETRKEAQNG